MIDSIIDQSSGANRLIEKKRIVKTVLCRVVIYIHFILETSLSS